MKKYNCKTPFQYQVIIKAVGKSFPSAFIITFLSLINKRSNYNLFYLLQSFLIFHYIWISFITLLYPFFTFFQHVKSPWTLLSFLKNANKHSIFPPWETPQTRATSGLETLFKNQIVSILSSKGRDASNCLKLETNSAICLCVVDTFFILNSLLLCLKTAPLFDKSGAPVKTFFRSARANPRTFLFGNTLQRLRVPRLLVVKGYASAETFRALDYPLISSVFGDLSPHLFPNPLIYHLFLYFSL